MTLATPHGSPWRRIAAAVAIAGLASCTSVVRRETALGGILDRIERRDATDGFLVQCLERGDEPTKAWAARGLGATRQPEGLSPLLAALEDDSRWVKAAALAALPALDLVADDDRAARSRALRTSLRANEPALRYLAAQGLGRVVDVTALDELVEGLLDPTPTVRQAAALALLSLVGDRIRGDANRAVDEARRSAVADRCRRALAIERDKTTRWHLVYALAHMTRPDNASTLRDQVQSRATGRWARMFALRGLGHLPKNPANQATILSGLADPDDALVIEAARALARTAMPDPDRRVIDALARILAEHDSAHARAAAVTALGQLGPDGQSRAQVASEDPSPTVRAAWLEAEGRGGATNPIAAWLKRRGDAGAWRVQLGAARGLRWLRTPDVAEILDELPDLDPRVGLAVLESLAQVDASPALIEFARRAVRRDDAAFAEAAADALAELGAIDAVADLMSAWRRGGGDGTDSGRTWSWAEARKHIAAAIRRLAPDAPQLREIGSRDPVARVRRAAIDNPPTKGLAERPRPAEPVPNAFVFERPRAELSTDRGTIVFELLPEMAPNHCFNFVRRAEQDDYDGRLFHRVVANFVAQGGDERGDGFGNVAWFDGPLRDELNPIRFLAGRVGMPRTADRDTGGDQMFVTLVPTPHLDGRYTAFARVVEGLDIARQLEVGDRILDIRITR